MKKTLMTTLVTFILTINFALGQKNETSQVEVLAKIQKTGDAVRLIRSNEGDIIPSVLQDKKLEQVISKLDPGDEALVKGHITYQAQIIEGKTNLRPIFVIESISPISLRRLGDLEGYSISETAFFTKSLDSTYSPLTIPITTEVASAITLTTTILLMQSLTANPSQPQGAQQLNSGLFIFAGAIATGVFIYEQIKGINTK